MLIDVLRSLDKKLKKLLECVKLCYPYFFNVNLLYVNSHFF